MQLSRAKSMFLGAVRHHVPPPLFFIADQLRGRCNAAESTPNEYFIDCQTAWKDCGLTLSGKRVLELGSGRYARVALRMLADGASRVTLVDHYATALTAPEHRSLLAQDCQALGLDLDNALARIEGVTDDFLDLSPPDRDRQVDLITSRYVLEHVRDPARVLQQCWNWLKPGGAIHHTIDLGCHGFSDSEFEMLTFSDRRWNSWFNPQGGFHLNRWRLPEYLDAAQKAQFIDIRSTVFASDRPALDCVSDRLDDRFLPMKRDLLAAVRVHLFAKKPDIF